MADPPTDPATDDDARLGTPRWVKVFGIIAAALVLLFVISLLIGGGDHGPGRHAPPASLPDHATRQP